MMDMFEDKYIDMQSIWKTVNRFTDNQLSFYHASELTATDLRILGTFRRFEIKKFKTQKWVSMFLSYLVENFFLVILRTRIIFGF